MCDIVGTRRLDGVAVQAMTMGRRGETLPGPSAHSACSFSRSAVVRPAAYTVKPASFARTEATPRPRPRDAPVTMATLPLGSAGAAAVASVPSTTVVTFAPSSVSSLVDSAAILLLVGGVRAAQRSSSVLKKLQSLALAGRVRDRLAPHDASRS